MLRMPALRLTRLSSLLESGSGVLQGLQHYMVMWTKYFKESEFACKHCGAVDMDATFINLLTQLRRAAAFPFVINSGFRCPEHNRAEGGHPNSSHLVGKAADVRAEANWQKFRIVREAIRVGFTRIGVGKTFVHLDYDLDKPQETLWTY